MNKRAKLILTILVTVLVLALIGWLVWQNNELRGKNQTLEENKQATQQDTDKESAVTNTKPEETAKPQFTITEQLKENIKAALETMNTQPMAGLMAPQVEVVLAASEGVPPRNPDEATRSLDYFSSAKSPWNFDLGASTLDMYRSSEYYKQYFEGNILAGKAASGEVVSFRFNDSGKIDRIFMSISEDILAQ